LSEPTKILSHRHHHPECVQHSGKRDRAPELMRGSQGSGGDRPALEGSNKNFFALGARRLFLAIVATIVIAAVTPAVADFESGRQAYQRGDYTAALSAWRPLAERGDAKAQNNIGAMYFHGKGVERDRAKAAEWYLKAAQQGHAQAQTSLGVMYYHGQGVVRDHRAAAEWYLKAAKRGDAFAAMRLGHMYDRGEGVKRDFAQALAWYRKAAGYGHAQAQNILGRIHDEGRGVAEDPREAARWYSLAAEQGFARAQLRLAELYREGRGVAQDDRAAAGWLKKAAAQGLAQAQTDLGLLYSTGRGVAQDFVLAHLWWSLAAAQGSEEGAKGRDYAEGQMSPAQLVQARKLASDWGIDTASITLASPAAAEAFKVGQEAYQRGNFAAALEIFRPLAHEGHAEAQYNLGLMHANGQGVALDYITASDWYFKAAAQNLATAQYNLGLMYGLGQGVEKSYVHAHMWWTLAAEQGHGAAAKNRDIVAGGMSDEELKRSRNLAGSQRR